VAKSQRARSGGLRAAPFLLDTSRVNVRGSIARHAQVEPIRATRRGAEAIDAHEDRAVA